MKFLCDQCKAKYQIADEKVQGKTLRMKCRKCGHIIEIRALTGDTKPSSMPPPGAIGETMQVGSLSEDAAHALLNPPIPAAPKAPTPAPKPAAPAKPGAPPRPTNAGPPRAGAAVGNATRMGMGGAPAKPAAAPPRTTEAPKSEAAPDSALASAFTRSVAKKPEVNASGSQSSDPPAEEWYVAIDEVPVGPIRLTDLRSKYGSGAVSDDSLVWREGFEEWRPLRTLTDLYELVREEVSQPRGSILPPVGPNAPRASSPRAPGAARNSTTSSPRPAPAAQSPGRSNVIPFQRQAGAAALKIEQEDDDEVTRISSAPIFPPTSSPSAAENPGGAAAMARAGIGGSMPSPRIVDDPFATRLAEGASSTPHGSMPAPIIAPVPVPVMPPHDFSTTQERRSMLERMQAKGVSKGLVALIAAGCLLLGVVIAVLVVKRMVVTQEKVIVQEKIVERPITVAATATVNPESTTSAATTSATATKVAVKTGGGTSGATSTATTTTTTATTNSKLKGIDDGPPVPDNTTGGGGGGGDALDGKAVEVVAHQNAVGVRKHCYEPLVETGAADAKINVHIRADGGVSQVDLLSGSPPTFASCVQKMAYNWHFPSSGTGGTFPIPYIFK